MFANRSDKLLPNQRLKLSARGAPPLSECPVEAIFLVCGAGRPQLKRDPLGRNRILLLTT